MKKIGIIIYGYPLGVSPSIINSAILLARADYQVHIFIDKPTFANSPIDFYDSNIVLHALDLNSGIWNKEILVFHKNRFRKVPIGNIFRYIHSKLMTNALACKLYLLFNRGRSWTFTEDLPRYTKHFFRNLFRFYSEISNHIDDEYIGMIGIERHGLIVASLISTEKKTPTIYFNLELFLEKECKTPVERIRKSLERECNRKSLLTIIQDERRAKYLMDDNDIPESKIAYVPVSGLGEVHRDKSDYLYRALGIPKEKRIILYAGNITPWSMCLDIARAAHNWNEDIVLVLHTWKSDAGNDPYVNQIKKLPRNKKVYLSLNPVEWDSLPELLSSADIGLIFYQNLGENFYETGSSSNKLAQYLQVGLPLITIDFPSFREVIEGYKCGKCAQSPEEIEKLANAILSNYGTYRENAFKCYREKYEFSKYFQEVVDRIEETWNSQKEIHKAVL